MHFSVTIVRQLIRERSSTNKSSCISSSTQLGSEQSQRPAPKTEKQIVARYTVSVEKHWVCKNIVILSHDSIQRTVGNNSTSTFLQDLRDHRWTKKYLQVLWVKK